MDDAELDPCPRRTRSGLPCGKTYHHRGACSPADNVAEEYRLFVINIRLRATYMRRVDLERAAEFHRLSWRIYREELNAR